MRNISKNLQPTYQSFFHITRCFFTKNKSRKHTSASISAIFCKVVAIFYWFGFLGYVFNFFFLILKLKLLIKISNSLSSLMIFLNMVHSITFCQLKVVSAKYKGKLNWSSVQCNTVTNSMCYVFYFVTTAWNLKVHVLVFYCFSNFISFGPKL